MHKKLLAHLRFANRVLAKQDYYFGPLDCGSNAFECLERNETLVRIAAAHCITPSSADVQDVVRRFIRHANGHYNKYVAVLDLPF